MFKICQKRQKRKPQRRLKQTLSTANTNTITTDNSIITIDILEINSKCNPLICPSPMPLLHELKIPIAAAAAAADASGGCDLYTMMKPHEPMLAKVPNTFKNLDYTQYLYEEKYDGERMLAIVHQDYNLNRFYTRNLKLCNIFMHTIELQFGVKQCIVDGEVVYMNECGGTIIPICDAGHRNAMHVEYRIFDIQSVDGISIRHKTLRERKSILESSILESQHVKLSQWHLCENQNVVNRAFDAITANINGEGLMLKHLDGIYKPGVREWLKMKAINILQNRCEYDLYIHKLMPDKNGILSILDCGYYDDAGVYVHVVYVSGGINNDLRTKLKLMSDEATHRLNSRQIVTIHADRRVTSNKSLRHPVVHRLRYDITEIDKTPFLN